MQKNHSTRRQQERRDEPEEENWVSFTLKGKRDYSN
jgi:hypothetical protein